MRTLNRSHDENRAEHARHLEGTEIRATNPRNRAERNNGWNAHDIATPHRFNSSQIHGKSSVQTASVASSRVHGLISDRALIDSRLCIHHSRVSNLFRTRTISHQNAPHFATNLVFETRVVRGHHAPTLQRARRQPLVSALTPCSTTAPLSCLLHFLPFPHPASSSPLAQNLPALL